MATAYAAQLLDAIGASPTGKIDVIAHSYSAFELSIVLERYGWALRDGIDEIVLLGPTEVRGHAFDGIPVRVVFAEGDWVMGSPYHLDIRTLRGAMGGFRLGMATDLRHARNYPISVPDAGLKERHNGWFMPRSERYETMREHLVASLRDL